MSKPPRNSYDNDDLKSVVEEIEGFISNENAAKAEAKKTREREVKTAKNRAKQLNIPNDILTAQLKERDLDRKTEAKRAKIVGSVKEDNLELFEESSGQLSWFKIDDDAPKVSATQAAIDRRKQEIQAKTDAEQTEGEEVLEELAGGEAVH